MKNLRLLHLYLGCLFTPMLLFFALSGLWQTFGLHWPKGNEATLLTYLSTIHTGRGLKTPGPSTLSSTYMHWFVVAMAIAFILTILLGLAMAFKFGHRKIALCCLLAGIVLPTLLVLIALN